MGCVLAKPTTLEDSHRDISISEHDVSRETAQRREGNSGLEDSNGTAKSFLIDKKPSSSIEYLDDHHSQKKNMIKVENVSSNNSLPRISVIPKSREGEQIAAGWPSWLVSVAGESLRGWIPRKAETFEKLDKIGQGTYSSVYKAQDLIHSKLVALKRVRFDNLDRESVSFMAREIIVLRRLNHPNIIKLEGIIASPSSSSLYLIFEYMEHDLTGLASIPEIRFTEPQVKCYMKQLLNGLEHCHSRGVLHRDIKGSNLLINNSGILKIADFGLASLYDSSKNFPLTSRVVTLWYRPPELLLGAIHYNEAVDMWSTGCILGELYYGKPLMPGRTEIEQIHKIFKLCGSPPEEFWTESKLRHSAIFKPHQAYRRRIAERFMDVPTSALKLIETLLSFDPAFRGTATSALNSEYFSTEPLACEPSSLPKYPPSKEIDVKMREEEKKRRDAVEGSGTTDGPSKQQPEHYEAALADKASANLVASVQIQERKRQSFLTNRNQTFNSYVHQPENAKQTGKEIFDHLRFRGLHTGPLNHGSGVTSTRAHRPVGPSIYAGPTRRPGPSNQPDLKGNEEWLYHSQPNIYSNRREDKGFVSRPTMNSNMYGSSDEYKMQYSGPLMNNVDEMMRDRDRQIQEMARRARVEKPNHSRLAANLLLPVYRR